MNLIRSLQTLLKETESNFEIRADEESGKIVLTLKHEILRSSDS
jgi:hypothetical protein